MKNLTEFINEANLDQGINELVTLFKDTIIKGIDITEDDFEELDDNIFNLCNVTQDPKAADNFFKGRAKISHAAISCEETDDYKQISLVQPGKEDIFIRINLDTEDGEGYKKGDIISADMSKEIKNELI